MTTVLTSRAAIHTETIEYKQGDTTLEGYLAYDDAISGKRPGVLVVHQWLGLTDYEKHRAEQLAQLGYVAFCADIYGKDIRPKNVQEAGALAGKYKSDRRICSAPASMPRSKCWRKMNSWIPSASRPSAIVLAAPP